MTMEAGGVPLQMLFERLLNRHPGTDGRAVMRLVERAVGAQLAAAPGPVDELGGSLEDRLHQETQELAELLRQTRMDIASLRPESITEEHLPVAGKELEAIVSATESATNEIMEAAEAIEACAEQLPEDVAEAISGGITRIFEACSFQDITGQRISKVVTALQQVEEKVGTMLATLEGTAGGQPLERAPAEAPAVETEADREQSLMNGPQAVEEAPSQEDIDALFEQLG